jgi:aryl-phospho-beta-D-glucosidase BglC (GH1 family)
VDTYGQLTPQEAVVQMGRGINLGNTMEPPDEGDWNNGPAQEYYFDDYKEAGFTNVRIPVTWNGHTSSASPYTVNAAWMDRVEEVVDWGLERGLFVILNAHHDYWIKGNYTAANKARFDSLWSQIAVRFQDKSDSLLFEIINEPNPLPLDSVNQLNARVLSIIRKTNPTRIVLFSGHRWSNAEELVVADIPEDDYIMGYFHSYDPYPFGLEGTGSFTSSNIPSIISRHNSVQNWAEDNNIPVLLGEFGAITYCEYNSRMLHYATVTEQALKHGFAFSAWDDGGEFRIYQRETRGWNELKDILIHTYETSPTLLEYNVVGDSNVVLSWTNRTTENDSIDVEWKMDGEFVLLERLPPASDSLMIHDLDFDTNYYFRLKTTVNDTLMYSYPIRFQLEKPSWTEPFSRNLNYSVFPNPAGNRITVRSYGNIAVTKIEIFDYSGKLIRTTDMLSDEKTIDIASLDKGVYYIRLVSSGQTLTKRFVKL